MTMTLEEAIEQQINLGVGDPHLIYDKLASLLGDELREMVDPYIADFVGEMARQKVNARRRAAIAKITAATLADPEIKLRWMWVPTPGAVTYKRIAEMTADDFDARANYLERMARGILRHAQWCRDVARTLRDQDKQTAAELDVLPALPDEDEVAY